MRRILISATFCLAVALAGGVFRLPAQEVRYGTGKWDADTLGNHRAVLNVAGPAEIVRARIDWRRRDLEPEKKNVILIEGNTGARVKNLLLLKISRPFGEILFQAQSPGAYYAYYLPFTSKGRNYPVVTYSAQEDLADPAWKTRASGLSTRLDSLPQATLGEIQAIDEFNSFYPMEVIATPEETERLLAAHAGKKFLLFPEDRSYPIRMTADLPQKWIKEGPKPAFSGEALPGEFYAFQIGLYASAADIQDIAVSFTSLRMGGNSIPSTSFRCINTNGTNWDGAAFKKVVSVRKGQVQPLWFGIEIPAAVQPGMYQGKVSIEPVGMPLQSVDLLITVKPDLIENSGDNEPWRHSRLRWLDSMVAFDDELVSPFTRMMVLGDTVWILGRRLTIGISGLPEQIESLFTPEVTREAERGKGLLTGPMDLIVENPSRQRLKWVREVTRYTRREDGIVEWRASSTSGPLRMELAGLMEFDGFVQFHVTLSTAKDLDVGDIRLEMPLAKEAVKYMMGLGLKGGFRPASHEWSWDLKKNQDGAWLGDVNAGFQFSLRAENYSRPLNTNFYQSKPLNMPPSWFNDGKGGITIREAGNATLLVNCYSGQRKLQPDRDLHFDFNLLLTPFKLLDTKSQWSTRFYHAFKTVDEAMASGADTINVHHANDVNPYINYPFLHQNQMRRYIDEAHQKGMKVKIYDTIRELSNHAPELFALRSLGNEIFSEGPGGGFSWLQEHLISNYIPAWFVPQLRDAAIINSGMSRWHNYYIEGLDWLVRNMQIDGLYIDDLAFDRTTMKRVRKVLDRGRPEAIIDLHSANQYNPRDGFTNSANLYLEHFPYINRLWFGEYFDPNSPPDFWLIEMSGIPYGLMGEMLQDGGNRWRGMIYGMTSRMPYDGNDPSPVWKVWDEFKIQESEMIGYWSPRCPVRTGNKDVMATAYVKRGKALISVASWAPEDVEVRLTFDWDAMRIDPGKATLSAPEVKDFQPAAKFDPNGAVKVPKGKGWLLIISE